MQKVYTITGKTDGFGAQYHAIMSGIAICKYKNYESKNAIKIFGSSTEASGGARTKRNNRRVNKNKFNTKRRQKKMNRFNQSRKRNKKNTRNKLLRKSNKNK